MIIVTLVALILPVSIFSDQLRDKTISQRCDALQVQWEQSGEAFLGVRETYEGKEKLICYVTEFINTTGRPEAHDYVATSKKDDGLMEPVLKKAAPGVAINDTNDRNESLPYNLVNKMCRQTAGHRTVAARIRHRDQIFELRSYAEKYLKENGFDKVRVPMLTGLIHIRGMGFIWISGNNGTHVTMYDPSYEALYDEMPFWVDPTFHPYLNTTEIHCHRFVIWTCKFLNSQISCYSEGLNFFHFFMKTSEHCMFSRCNPAKTVVNE
ncbi:unnamed protein product [Gongylonema pulchrum]|uniref:Gln_deamidase_2 domain-containing protein n=1 Tax=Gongylonema pulchrum TaxID=637853 RepID=A0A183DVG2_9BILA|nr:unnamed protein product [Gongylonema pulchrum]